MRPCATWRQLYRLAPQACVLARPWAHRDRPRVAAPAECAAQATRAARLLVRSAAGSAVSPVQPDAPTRPPNPSGAARHGVKRAVALHVAFVGTAFRGSQLHRAPMQLPAGQEAPEGGLVARTVEADIELALLRANLILESNFGSLHKLKWTRSSRTDKGVHALSLVVGVRLMVSPDEFELDPEGQALAASINAHLPRDVRVLAVQRVNKKFNARRLCIARAYTYYLPAHVLGLQGDGSERDAAVLALFRAAMGLYVGRRAFHNFAARRTSYLDQTPSARARRKARESNSASDIGGIRIVTGSSASGIGAGGTSGDTGASSVAGQDAGNEDNLHLTPSAAAIVFHGDNQATERRSQDGPSESQAVAFGNDWDSAGAEHDTNEGGGSELSDTELSEDEAQTDDAPMVMVDGEWKSQWVQRIGWKSEIDPLDKVMAVHYRQIRTCSVADPRLLTPGGTPCLELHVAGNSFMLHQIRNMIGAAVAVARGVMPLELLQFALSTPARITVPRAPPHSLTLAQAVFAPFPRQGGEPKAITCSGEALALRDAGRAAQQAFKREVLDAQLNQLLDHPDWKMFSLNLDRYFYDLVAHEDCLRHWREWRAAAQERAVLNRAQRQQQEGEQMSSSGV